VGHLSQYYLGDPCYVIPDDEWGDFCSIMRDDGHSFEYKGERCRVIGTGGDGDFGGLSVDAGIIGVIPVVLCDPQALKDTVPSDARLIDNFADLECSSWGDIIIVDGEAINGYQCECDYHVRGGGRSYAEWIPEDQVENCGNCGRIVAGSCMHFGPNDGIYCSEDCAPDPECEYCGNDFDDCGETMCDDCRYYSLCGCTKDDPSDDADQCSDCKKADEEE
jgi:hypothetical protein